MPTHRALADARATVDVLHGLIGRLGNLGVHSLPELRDVHRAGQRRPAPQAAPGRRRCRTRPGVYIFRDAHGQAALRRHQQATCAPGSGSTSWPARPAAGWARWSGWPSGVDAIACAHPLEAQVRELRLIAAHKPRYNRRSKFPRAVGLAQAHRRAVPAAVDRARPPSRTAPPTSARCARSGRPRQLRDAIHDAVPLRQCTDRLSPAPAGAGRLRAGRHRPVRGALRGPDQPGAATPRLAETVVRRLAGRRVRPLIRAAAGASSPTLSDAQRYEEAAGVRDRIATLVRSCARMQTPDRADAGSPSWSPPGRTARAAGSSRSSGTAGWSAPGWPAAGCRRCRWSTRCWRPPRSCRRPDLTTAAARRGDRAAAALARRAGHPAGPGQRAVVLAGGRRGQAAHWLASAELARRSPDPFADRRRLPVASRPAAL